MENLTYVTSNYGKYIQVKKEFEQNKLDIYYFKYDLDEPNINDINFISKQKAIQAYNLRLQMPDFMGFVGLLFFYSRRTRTRYPFLRFTICAITFPLSVFLSCVVIQNNFYFFPKYILQFPAFSAD